MRGPFPFRATLVTLAAAAMVVTAAPPVPAADGFTFYGSGYGHGIGMSQYGAYGLAKKGWSASRILLHYYTGVRLARREPPKQDYRVGLLQYASQLRLQASEGSFELRLSGGRLIDTVRRGQTRVVKITGGRFQIEKPDGTVVGDRQWGSKTRHLQARRKGGAVIRVPEWGHRAGRGMLEVRVAGQASGHLAAILDPEQYLFGLGEVPSSWPMAVLKAQAMAARTYAHRRVADGRTGCACDILGDTRDQAYTGWDKEAGTDGDRWVRAVKGTAQRIVTYGGQAISTMYSSSSGGFTENVENVWGGSPQPYLKGVCDPGDYVSSNPSRTWEVSMTGAEMASRLRSAFGWSVDRVTAVQVRQRGVSGRVVLATVEGVRADGSSFSASADGWDLRGALGLRDFRFWVNADRQVEGAIRGAYDAAGCKPGLPTSAKRSEAGGIWQRFKKGRIYAKDGVRAWVRHARLLSTYLSKGGPTGPLGYPTSQQRKLKDGRVRVLFEGGSITCSSSSCVTR